MIKNKHKCFRGIFRMRDGPPADTGPPKTGPHNNGVTDYGMNATGPSMEWVVLKQTRARVKPV